MTRFVSMEFISCVSDNVSASVIRINMLLIIQTMIVKADILQNAYKLHVHISNHTGRHHSNVYNSYTTSVVKFKLYEQ
jgi:hypothetical protein